MNKLFIKIKTKSKKIYISIQEFATKNTQLFISIIFGIFLIFIGIIFGIIIISLNTVTFT